MHFKSCFCFRKKWPSTVCVLRNHTTDGITNRCGSFYMSLCASCFAAPLVAVRVNYKFVTKPYVFTDHFNQSNFHFYDNTNHWRIQGGAPGMRAPPWGPNSFIFMQFSAKMWKIIAILGVGAPPGENPGSATANGFIYFRYTILIPYIS